MLQDLAAPILKWKLRRHKKLFQFSQLCLPSNQCLAVPALGHGSSILEQLGRNGRGLINWVGFNSIQWECLLLQ